jgi:hypothetical protein
MIKAKIYSVHGKNRDFIAHVIAKNKTQAMQAVSGSMASIEGYATVEGESVTLYTKAKINNFINEVTK